jgi:hypothetical protein
VKGGPSPNPGGVPKDFSAAVLEARRLALSYAPQAIKRLAEMLDSADERIVVAAAESLLDRAGLKPYSTEPERHEVLVANVDVEALRSSLAARIVALAGGRQGLPAPALPPADGTDGGVP